MIFFVQVSTTDVSGGVDDMKRAVKEGAAATTYLDPIDATPLVLLLCAVNERARVLSWARVARRSRDFILVALWRFAVDAMCEGMAEKLGESKAAVRGREEEGKWRGEVLCWRSVACMHAVIRPGSGKVIVIISIESRIVKN
eukprot:scaffold10518_cov78-Skeletonema_dohrnii-CCMP3373.AAC.1